MDGGNISFEFNLHLLVAPVEFILGELGMGVFSFPCYFPFAFFLLVDRCFYLTGI